MSRCSITAIRGFRNKYKNILLSVKTLAVEVMHLRLHACTPATILGTPVLLIYAINQTSPDVAAAQCRK